MEKIVVVKIGSRVLVSTQGKIRLAVLSQLAQQVSAVYEAGWHPIIVTSGAIDCGNGFIGKGTLLEKQVAAMVGQPELMAHWRDAFKQWGMIVGQVLGTHRDFLTKDMIAVINQALRSGIIPILNENDSASVEEIEAAEHHGDNDALAAIVAQGIKAKKLILLSDVDGLFEQNPAENPNARPIPVVAEITPDIMTLATKLVSSRPTGMKPKLEAAQMATVAGVTVHLASGNLPDVVTRIIAGIDVPGTTFLAA
ncbi:MAG: glutamate 5-kinase [Patescibacteria group bacterium]|nr:glutamate 5-kinase [Patescibacteria group bacterium]